MYARSEIESARSTFCSTSRIVVPLAFIRANNSNISSTNTGITPSDGSSIKIILGFAIIARAAALYSQRYGEADGRIPATFEIVNLAGWAPHESQPKPLPRGSARVRLADALGVVEHGRRDN